MSSESPESLEPRLFHCPNCGAGLPDPDSPSVRCTYCGSNVLVPPEYLPPKPLEPIVIRFNEADDAASSPARRAGGRNTLVILLLVFGLGLAIIILTFAGITWTTRTAMNTVNQFTTQVVVTQPGLDDFLATLTPLETPTATPQPFASEALRFGAQGSGPGQFDDPRQVAVDLGGNIFVADYDTGRVQKFAPDGSFLQLWRIPPADNGINYISDLAADTQGKAYAARGGDILVYADNNQQAVNVFPGSFPDTDYNALAIDSANYIYSLANSMTGDDLVKLDQNGQVLLRQPGIVYDVNQETPAENDVIAVDGRGNTYYLSVFETQVYKYDAEGNYVDRFGSQGREAGQFFNPSKLAVDGQDRIYVLDNDYIHIFDQNGTFLKAFEWDFSLGSPRDIAVDPNGHVYIVTSQALVLKYLLSW